MQLWIHVNKVHGDLRNVHMRRIFLLLFFKYSGYVNFCGGRPRRVKCHMDNGNCHY
ncbi:hypothetical protein Hanom_Chr02g00149001 [Helianthus anomalus]